MRCAGKPIDNCSLQQQPVQPSRAAMYVFVHVTMSVFSLWKMVKMIHDDNLMIIIG